MKRILLQYDVAHGRLPRPERILEQAAILKEYGLNGVMLYLDGEGAQKSLPVRGSIPADYLTALKTGLRRLSLEFVPHIQTLGHLERMLARSGMEAWRDDPGGGRVVRIDSPEVRNGMKRYIAEAMELFGSEWIHCGGDEAWTLGLGVSRPYLAAAGLENALGEYWNELHQTVRARGGKMVLYADELIVYPALRNRLERDIVIANWGYCAPDEIFEQENGHYAAHHAVTAGRENWITGNSMAEYLFLPFPRLPDNLRVLERLACESGADTFVISDWGSWENISPMCNTLFGAIFVLRRLKCPDYGMREFLIELSELIFGKRETAFLRAVRTMLEAQSAKYWPRTICRTGPMLPRFFTGDPDQRMIGTLSAAIDPERLKRLKKEMEQACLLLDSLAGKTGVRRMQWLHDLRWTARRLLAAVLRAELCQRHAWYTGAVWISAAGQHALRQDYETYRNLAAGDIALHRKVWRRDCLPGGLGKSCTFLKTAVESAGKTIHCPENTLLYFPPEKT